MDDEIIISEKIAEPISRLSEFIDDATFVRIINKLTDYAEILSEGKLSGIINFNYELTSTQTNSFIEFLTGIQAVSKIYNLAFKGSRDLEQEYISNIFTDTTSPENVSSYLSLRNAVENRLNHQIQQYNMNMNRSSTTKAMSVNELRGHVKTYIDLSSSNVTVSTKAQHGIIAASLHDAYTALINRPDWWEDKTYRKFFFNEVSSDRQELLLLSKEKRLSLEQIRGNINSCNNQFIEIKNRKKESLLEQEAEKKESIYNSQEAPPETTQTVIHDGNGINDRMLATPFGMRYGTTIDKILNSIFHGQSAHEPDSAPREMMQSLFRQYRELPAVLGKPDYRDDILDIIDYLINSEHTLKSFAEKFLYSGRTESFITFYSSQNREMIEAFINEMVTMYYMDRFTPLYRVIRSQEVIKYACAFIIKRIYLLRGESLTNFGYYLIRAIAKKGGIRTR